MEGVFLDASIMEDTGDDILLKYVVKQERISFEFPNGFETLRLIEECRALNALDTSEPENFDLMYDIMMQMLVGKPVFIYYTENDKKVEIAKFQVTDRYMNLRGVSIIDEYPILVNWMVDYIARFLSKKFPRSLKDVQAKMSEREELMKKDLKQNKETVIVTTS